MEIDDIFNKKTTTTAATIPTVVQKKKKKKAKKSEKVLAAVEKVVNSKESKVIPETVVVVADTKIETNVPEDEENWADSRGKMPRKKTDDGFNIYSQDELRIGLGQDTPDCPFDCKCCY